VNTTHEAQTTGRTVRETAITLGRLLAVLAVALVLVIQTAGSASAEVYGDTAHGTRREMKERCGQAGGVWIDVPGSGGVCDLPGDSVWLCNYVTFTCVFIDVLSEGQPNGATTHGDVAPPATAGAGRR
jgi:hypothetical protein